MSTASVEHGRHGYKASISIAMMCHPPLRKVGEGHFLRCGQAGSNRRESEGGDAGREGSQRVASACLGTF